MCPPWLTRTFLDRDFPSLTPFSRMESPGWDRTGDHGEVDFTGDSAGESGSGMYRAEVREATPPSPEVPVDIAAEPAIDALHDAAGSGTPIEKSGLGTPPTGELTPVGRDAAGVEDGACGIDSFGRQPSITSSVDIESASDQLQTRAAAS